VSVIEAIPTTTAAPSVLSSGWTISAGFGFAQPTT
jgi:hypothetical protein